jgi:hypothetical protein
LDGSPIVDPYFRRQWLPNLSPSPFKKGEASGISLSRRDLPVISALVAIRQGHPLLLLQCRLLFLYLLIALLDALLLRLDLLLLRDDASLNVVGGLKIGAFEPDALGHELILRYLFTVLTLTV